MKESMKYRVEGFQDADNVGKGYDCSSEADTLKEAKHKARHMLTVEYRDATETAECLQYCRVMRVLGGHERDDEVVWDIVKKGIVVLTRFKFRPDKHDPDDPDAPRNGSRALHAEAGLAAFLRSTGESRTVDEDAVRDLMADLLHYCDKFGHDGAKILASAERNWQEER